MNEKALPSRKDFQFKVLIVFSQNEKTCTLNFLDRAFESQMHVIYKMF